ncbi:hypothetical protein SAMN05421770_102573 [Granulicella rosea]|uniref:Uncharacterized protein n=2 Tax=Granulicella rosea TaxID=474952 RepID=A0A239HUF1_9BACT|nr:hypothetical protein SAMN05421770_102573 [Granulicella rosea]
MLRVYAAAHGMNSPYHGVVEVSAEDITLRVNDRWVRFTHDALETSEGSTAGFALQEDGNILIGEVSEEMDMAAEQVARRMLQGSE